MNVIDIILILLLAYALFEGFREGLVVQGCSFVGIAIGIWYGARHGDSLAKFLQIDGEYSSVWGFVIAIILAIIVVTIGAQVARRVLQMAGLGVLDRVLGMALSLFKMVIILSLLLSAFSFVNKNIEIISSNTLAKSQLYRPIVNVTKWASPAWQWTKEQLKQEEA